MVELLEQQQHVMERIVADEWAAHAGDGSAASSSSSSSSSSTAATTTSTAVSVTDTSMFIGEVSAKMLSSTSGRRAPVKRMMHFTSGRGRAAGRDGEE